MKEWLRRNEGKTPFIVTAILVVMVLAAMELAYAYPHFGVGDRSWDQSGTLRVRWGGFDRNFLVREPGAPLVFGQYDGLGGMVAGLWDWHQRRHRPLNIFVLEIGRSTPFVFTYDRCMSGTVSPFKLIELVELRGRRYEVPVIHSDRSHQACSTLDEGLRRAKGLRGWPSRRQARV